MALIQLIARDNDPLWTPEMGTVNKPCQLCKKPVRAAHGNSKNGTGYIFEGTLTLTMHRRRPRFESGPSDDTETCRYCPECAPMIADLLMEKLGFTFEAPAMHGPAGEKSHCANCGSPVGSTLNWLNSAGLCPHCRILRPDAP